MKKINTPSPLSLLSSIAQQFSAVYDDPVLCIQHARWTLEHITQQPLAQLMTQQTLELTYEQETILSTWIHKLIDEHMPIQYLLGSVPFCDLTIKVNPPILIPRPETEEWCLKLITELKKVPTDIPLRILDLCSGSGCIALALAHALPQATVIGTDINEDALMLARSNAHHNTITNASFVLSDLFNELTHLEPFDLIVANPPYIAPEFWHELDASVTTWEDRHALIAEDHGLAIIKKIIQQAPSFLRNSPKFYPYNLPHLVIEIDYTQGDSVVNLCKNSEFKQVHLYKDLEENDRVIWAQQNNQA